MNAREFLKDLLQKLGTGRLAAIAVMLPAFLAGFLVALAVADPSHGVTFGFGAGALMLWAGLAWAVLGSKLIQQWARDGR